MLYYDDYRSMLRFKLFSLLMWSLIMLEEKFGSKLVNCIILTPIIVFSRLGVAWLNDQVATQQNIPNFPL